MTVYCYLAISYIVWHSVVSAISSIFNRKVIPIDLNHGKKKNSGKTKELLVEDSIGYDLDDCGNKKPL